MINIINNPNQKMRSPGRSSYSNIWKYLSLVFVAVILMGVISSCVEDEGGEVPRFLDLATEVSSLDFGGVTTNTSQVLSYGLYGSELNGNVTVSTESPFQVSKSASEGFASSISFTPDELSGEIVNVYVSFVPTEVADYSASILHDTEGMIASPMVSLEGIGVLDPDDLPTLLFQENFEYDDDLLPSVARASDGTNPTLNGWLKVRAANKDLELTSDNLSFTGYPDSGKGKAVIIDRNPDVSGGQTNLLQHNINPQQTSNFVGSYYASFLFKAEDIPVTAGGYNSPLIFASWNPANGTSWWSSGFVVQNNKANDADDDNMVFGIRYESLNELTDKTMEIGKTYLVVLKHTITQEVPAEMETTATSTASIFIFEEGDGIDTDNEPTPLYTMENIPDKYFIRSVTLFQENDVNGRYILDGLRVTNIWEDIFK